MYALCVVQYCYRLLILPTFCTPCTHYIPAHLPVITFDINYHALAFLHFNIWLPCDRYTQPSSWFPLPGSVIIQLVGCGCVCWVANCRVYSHHRGGAKLRLIFIWTTLSQHLYSEHIATSTCCFIQIVFRCILKMQLNIQN